MRNIFPSFQTWNSKLGVGGEKIFFCHSKHTKLTVIFLIYYYFLNAWKSWDLLFELTVFMLIFENQ